VTVLTQCAGCRVIVTANATAAYSIGYSLATYRHCRHYSSWCSRNAAPATDQSFHTKDSTLYTRGYKPALLVVGQLGGGLKSRDLTTQHQIRGIRSPLNTARGREQE